MRAEAEIEHLALSRIASVFGLANDKVQRDWCFGKELIANPVSDFSRNEYDRISDDIHDVADKDALKALGSGALVIRTVGDYCDLMVRCSRGHLRKVLEVLDT